MARVLFAGRSDTGLKRSNNEDAYTFKDGSGFAALSDGRGGPAAGEMASQYFVQAVTEAFADGGAKTEADLLRLMQISYERANEKVFDHIKENPQHSGMGCTGELLVFMDKSFAIAHIGDSRAYLFRKKSLRQLTKDHSLVQEQIDRGIITPDQARSHRLRHVILRAVGTSENLEVDLIRGSAMTGDIFLLCSDGLTDMLEDGVIEEILSRSTDLSFGAERLIVEANSAGGKDNITVVLGQVLEG